MFCGRQVGFHLLATLAVLPLGFAAASEPNTAAVDGWLFAEQSSFGPQREKAEQSTEFAPKEIDVFPYLDQFELVEKFQGYIDDYVQSCIDSTPINTRTIPCFVNYELWDRELNKYYQLLLDQLPEESKALLRESQRLWIADRDKTVQFNSSLLDWRYKNVQGTMYSAMRAGDADEAIAPMIRQRALLLKHWFEMAERGPFQ